MRVMGESEGPLGKLAGARARTPVFIPLAPLFPPCPPPCLVTPPGRRQSASPGRRGEGTSGGQTESDLRGGREKAVRRERERRDETRMPMLTPPLAHIGHSHAPWSSSPSLPHPRALCNLGSRCACRARAFGTGSSARATTPCVSTGPGCRRSAAGKGRKEEDKERRMRSCGQNLEPQRRTYPQGMSSSNPPQYSFLSSCRPQPIPLPPSL
jgi:hypothetical protein